jgi:DNA-binding MarR family transcriptional regulator
MSAACSDTAMSAWLQLVRVHEKLQHHASSHLEGYTLTPAQYDVLAQLSDAPGMTQQALAERLMVTKGNVCGLIDRMSERGFVQRRPDPEDRRANLLFVTDLGRDIAEKAIPAYAQFVREHLAVLDDDEQRALEALLRKVEAALDHH